jgi:RND superfamily putative drug exporter
LSADTAPASSAPPPGPPDQPRRTRVVRWLLPAVLLVVWLVVGAVGGQFQGRLAEVQTNDNASFLPKTAESTEVLELQARFADSENFPAFVVIESQEPLTPDQLADIQVWAEAIPQLEVPVADAEPAAVGDFLAQGPIPVTPSEDGEAALVLVNFNADANAETHPDGESALQMAVE